MLLQLSLATIMVVTIAIVHLTGLAILTRVLRSHSRFVQELYIFVRLLPSIS